jgi:hypothetical protein
MKRTLIIAAFAAATFAAGPALAQTIITGGANVMPPPGGIQAADVMITSTGPVYATASVAEVVGSASTGNMMTAYAPRAGQSAWAQRRIEENGYRNVRNVALRPDGRWYGTATRGNREVAVVIDNGGNVAGM